MKENKKDKEKLPEVILSMAREHGIDLHSEPELQEIIESVNLEKKIPEEVYTILAELIIQVYKVKDQWKSKS